MSVVGQRVSTLEGRVFSDLSLLCGVVETSAAESLGSDSAGRNGINIELELVKQFNQRAQNQGEDLRLLTQRQMQELLQRHSSVYLEGERCVSVDLLEAFKSEQRFEAVDLFLLRRNHDELEILDWASLKTAQFHSPKRKSVEEHGSFITLFNDPQGELANYFMSRESTVEVESEICKVFTLVIFRDSSGLAENFSVFKTQVSPSSLLRAFPVFVGAKKLSESVENESGDLTFVDRLERTGKKATSFDRGVKIRYSTMLREPEGFRTLVKLMNVDTERIQGLYRELYSLEGIF